MCKYYNNLSCTCSIWAGKLHWLDKVLLYTVTDRNISFIGTIGTCYMLRFSNLDVNPFHFQKISQGAIKGINIIHLLSWNEGNSKFIVTRHPTIVIFFLGDIDKRFMCIRCKSGERLDGPHLYHNFKPHTHQLYILRHYTNIVYIFYHFSNLAAKIYLNWYNAKVFIYYYTKLISLYNTCIYIQCFVKWFVST